MAHPLFKPNALLVRGHKPATLPCLSCLSALIVWQQQQQQGFLGSQRTVRVVTLTVSNCFLCIRQGVMASFELLVETCLLHVGCAVPAGSTYRSSRSKPAVAA